MKNTAKILFPLVALVLAPLAWAQHQSFSVNPDASSVAFALGGNFHAVNGTFHVQSGAIDFDRTAQTIGGSVVVAAGSGNSGESGRDKKMNNDVLETSKFAEVTFAPKSYQGSIAASGDSTIQVTGVFTLHGAAHDLTVPMKIHIEGGAATAETHFVIPYVQWGLKDPSIFIAKVAKEVGIDIKLVGKVS